MPRKKQKRQRSWKWMGRLIFVLLFVGAGVMVFMVMQEVNGENKEDNTVDTAQNENQEGGVNYGAPSEEEIAAGEDIKKNRQEEEAKEPADSRDGEVFIVDAGQYSNEVEVRARIEGVMEDGGSCKYVFARGGHSLTKTRTAVSDAMNTSCGALVVPVVEFPESGEWTVTVSYKEATTSSTKVEVRK